ncbi:MAG: hypothetical protein K6E84_04910 [Lachnospiraceae bacterium]|nr:hypothetical protein [Lachnospiraceae bacterium]
MPEYSVSIIWILVNLVILAGLIRLIKQDVRAVPVIFFGFGSLCILFSSLYWIVYALLRPDVRMPFAANEIAEWAIFLSFGASLKAASEPGGRASRREILSVILFIVANVALWIAWSGEWLQDIATGIVFGYYVAALAVRMNRTEAVSLPVRRLWGLVCILLVAGQAATFFTQPPLKDGLDLFCYALLLLTELYLVIKAVGSLSQKKTEVGTDSMSLSFAVHAWGTVFLYMSADAFYTIAGFFVSLGYLLMYLSFRREEGT